jgi:hypothetical protein
MRIIKDFDWSETETTVFIHIPVSSKPISLSVFATDTFVKLSFSGFLFELDLPFPIKYEKSVCQYSNASLDLTLYKQSYITWHSLIVENAIEKREASIKRYYDTLSTVTMI